MMGQGSFVSLLVLASLSVTIQTTEEDITGPVIGIDLGTTYSCVGVYINDHVEIIANDQGNRVTPSYVTFTPDGGQLVGEAAKNMLTETPANTVFNVKRLIGRVWDDPNVQREIKYLPYTVDDILDKPYVQINTGEEEKLYAPEEISAFVLKKMKLTAEGFLGKSVTHAVVTVPAYFNNAQRQATKEAGRLAGLNIIRIINEPTAAALSYGYSLQGSVTRNMLVLDMGGGTFDVSLLLLDQDILHVIATAGDVNLGGEDFNLRTMEYFIELYRKKTGYDIIKDRRATQRLRMEVETAKLALSSQTKYRLEIDKFYNGEDFSEVLTRARFEELNKDLFRATIRLIKKVLKDANHAASAIDDIVLVGGSTRLPKVWQLVKEFFNGKEPTSGVNPEEAVAYGAAIQGAILSGALQGSQLQLRDISHISLGVGTSGGKMNVLIERNTVIPTNQSEIFYLPDGDQDSVTVNIYEGEEDLAADNYHLGSVELSGLKPTIDDDVQIKITFAIDANGIFTVAVEDIGSGVQVEKTINNNPKTDDRSAESKRKMLMDFASHYKKGKKARSSSRKNQDSDVEDWVQHESDTDEAYSGVGTVLAISLGTSYSSVGVFRNGYVKLIPNEHGNTLTPSCVAFSAAGDRLLGDSALNQLTSNPDNTMFSLRRIIGRSWDDISMLLDIKYWPFAVEQERLNVTRPVVKVKAPPLTELDWLWEKDAAFSPEEVTAMLIQHLKDQAETYLGEKVRHTVLTVPAHYRDGQRHATKDAAAIAGLKVLRLVNEPTAAALAFYASVSLGLHAYDVQYGSTTNSLANKKKVVVLAFDLGGGCLDVSVIEIRNGIFQVISAAGDPAIGGDDLNLQVMKYFIGLYMKRTGVDIRTNKVSVQKLRREVERAKRALSTELETVVEIDNFIEGEPLFSQLFTRSKFEELNKDMFKACVNLIREVLDTAQMSKKDIDEVILSGGSTKIPRIQQLIRDFFRGKEPIRSDRPEEVAVTGAAVMAGVISRHERVEDILLHEVSAHSLGISITGGRMSTIIPKDTRIPAKNNDDYTVDNDPSCIFNVYEGEDKLTENNKLLGKFNATGVIPAADNKPTVDVTFTVDRDGILTVAARNNETVDVQDPLEVVSLQHRLSSQDIARMRDNSLKYNRRDAETRERQKKFNSLERYTYFTKHLISKTNKVADTKSARQETLIVTKLIDETIEWMETDGNISDAEEIEEQLTELQAVIRPYLNKHSVRQHDEL